MASAALFDLFNAAALSMSLFAVVLVVMNYLGVGARNRQMQEGLLLVGLALVLFATRSLLGLIDPDAYDVQMRLIGIAAALMLPPGFYLLLRTGGRVVLEEEGGKPLGE